jgi:hypothetical protein
MREQVVRVQPNPSGEPTLAWSRADLNWKKETSLSTDGSGQIVVTHSLGYTPGAVFIQKISSNPYISELIAITGSTFTIQWRNSTTGAAAVGAQTVQFYWQAIGHL